MLLTQKQLFGQDTFSNQVGDQQPEQALDQEE
jgi:hypothetical protein